MENKESELWIEFSVIIEEEGMNIPFCGLCGNRGKIESVAKTPRGSLIEQTFFCICPNGRALKIKNNGAYNQKGSGSAC